MFEVDLFVSANWTAPKWELTISRQVLQDERNMSWKARFWYFRKVLKESRFVLFGRASNKTIKIRFRSLERPTTQGADLCWWWLEVLYNSRKIIYRISAMNLYGHLLVYGPKLRRHFMKSDCEGQWNSWSLLPWRWAQMSCAFIYEKSGIVILQTGHLLEIPGSIWSWQAHPYHDRWR